MRPCLSLALTALLAIMPLAADAAPALRPSDELLIVSAEAGMIDLMRTRLDGSVYVDSMDHAGRTALMLAARHGHIEGVDLLLRRGADPERMDQSGKTAAVWALRRGHMTIMHQILAWQAGTQAYQRQVKLVLAAAKDAYDAQTVARLKEIYGDPTAQTPLVDAQRWPRPLITGYDAGGGVRLPAFLRESGGKAPAPMPIVQPSLKPLTRPATGMAWPASPPAQPPDLPPGIPIAPPRPLPPGELPPTGLPALPAPPPDANP